MSIVKDTDGKHSSKRAMGIMLIVLQQILFIYKEINHQEIVNPEIFIGMVCTGGSLLGIAIFEYFSRQKQQQKQE